MSKMSSRLLVLAVAGTVFVLGFGSAAVIAGVAGVSQQAAHQNPGATTNAQCIACHGEMRVQPSLDPRTHTAHMRHLYSAFLTYQTSPTGCVSCHVSTDIWEGDGAMVGRQVNPDYCLTCHGQFTASSHGNVDLSLTDPRGCTVSGCHTNPQAIHAAVDNVNPFFTQGRAFCLKCHGGLDFYAAEETNPRPPQ